jgi:hypothetical protein
MSFEVAANSFFLNAASTLQDIADPPMLRSPTQNAPVGKLEYLGTPRSIPGLRRDQGGGIGIDGVACARLIATPSAISDAIIIDRKTLIASCLLRVEGSHSSKSV